MFEQYDHGLSKSEQLCYLHENASDSRIFEVLIVEAEKFFNKMVKELEQVVLTE